MRILITGGTGTFGNAAAASLLKSSTVSRIIIYSRDEQKQEQMARRFNVSEDKLAFFIGDVRDEDRLEQAFNSKVDVVVHAAAMKIVPKCEFDPIEAVKTNVYGTSNVVSAAIKTGVKRLVFISTDKAVSPANLYGATKLTAEKIFIAANNLVGADGPKFSVVRYGNVTGSRGSVVPLFKELHASGKPLTITSPDMTRFWMEPQQAVDLVMRAIGLMRGGEIFIPLMSSYNIMDLAHAVTGKPDFHHEIIGKRHGEKIHETMIADNEWPYVTECVKTIYGDGIFIVDRSLAPVEDASFVKPSYTSETARRLSVYDLKRMLAQ